MARVIKFRGKSLTDEWIYGDLIHMQDGGMAIWPKGQNGGLEVVANVSVGQYTGLRDGYGKEIYEGDILRMQYEVDIADEENGEAYHESGYYVGVVVIRSRGVSMNPCIRHINNKRQDSSPVSNKPVSGYRSKVIGNIHDNPELWYKSKQPWAAL